MFFFKILSLKKKQKGYFSSPLKEYSPNILELGGRWNYAE